jgi:hypothetical protein
MAGNDPKIWYVYRGSESLGPFSASELRAALRVGELDPFEKVGRVSSSVRQNLLDIDEIFNTKPLNDSIHKDAAEAMKAASVNEHTDPTLHQDLQVSSTSAHGSSFSNGYFGGAAVHRDAPSSRPPEDFRQNIKPFYVSIKGKFWGPFHAPEIIAEHRKGRIPKRAYVLRNGYKAKLPIEKFVSQYQRRLVARGPQKSLMHPMASDRKVFVLNTSDSTRWIAIAFVALCFLIASYLAYDYLMTTRADGIPPASQTVNSPSSAVNPAGISRLEIPAIQNVPRIASPKAVANKALPLPRVVQPQLTQPQVTQPQFNQPQQQVLVAPRRPAPVVRKPTTKPKPVTKPKPTLRKVVQKKPKAAPKAKPKKMTSTSTNLGSVPNLKSKIGKQVSLGPLSYSTSAVKRCRGKCTIRFKGRNGSVTGIFFKSAYGSTLVAKKGKARIKGRVMGGGKSLLVQGIN